MCNCEAQTTISLRLWEAVKKGLEEAVVKKCPFAMADFTLYLKQFLDTDQFSADYLYNTWS